MQISDFVGQYHNSTATAAEGLTPNKGVESLVSTIRSMTAGNIFEGTINSVKNGQVILGLSNGQQLSARLADASLQLLQGDSMFFQVKENDGGQIKIAPYKVAGAGANLTLISALSAAGLPMEGDYLAMVDKMMQEQMPIDKHSLAQMAKVLASNREADIQSLVEMKKLGIPITRENILSYENYRDETQSVVDGLRNYARAIPKVMADFSQEGRQLAGMNREILSIFTEVSDEEAFVQQNPGQNLMQTSSLNPELDLQQVLTKQEIENLDSMVRELVWDTPEEHMQMLDANTNGQEVLKTIQEALDAISKQPVSPEKKEAMVKLFSSPEFQTILEENIEQKWTIRPEDLTEEENKVNKLYEKLTRQLDQLEKAVKASGVEDADLLQMSQNLKNHVDFMNQINQFYQYVQIPLKLSGQKASGELMVYTNKANLMDPDQELSAFLHLDLDHLGATDISVKMLHKEVNTRFYIGDDKAYALIEKYEPLLQERLRKKGYNLSMEVVHDTRKVNVVKDLLRKDLPGGNRLKRYSFDIRA